MSNMRLPGLHERRIEICNEISGIETMRRGTVNEFYYNSTLKDGTIKMRGPFYNITTNGKNNKTITQSLPKKDVDQAKHDTDNYKKFRELSAEYVDICEEIAFLTHSDDEAKKN